MTPAGSLRTRIVRKLVHNLMAALILIAIGVAGVATQETAYAERPAVTDSAAALVAEHDCWTGEAPAGTIPGHVVATVRGEARYGGARLTGLALDQVFDGADHGLTVHAFCR